MRAVGDNSNSDNKGISLYLKPIIHIKKILITSCLCLASYFSSAEGDTIIRYFNTRWGQCEKDEAKYISKLYNEGDIWRQRDYLLSNNQLVREVNYSDVKQWKKSGIYKKYYENSAVSAELNYRNDTLVAGTYYYQNGHKKAEKHTNAKGEIEEQDWDDNGNVLTNYVVDKEAEFPGGMKAWKKHLEKNLNASIPTELGLPPGKYRIDVQFLVSETGEISAIQPLYGQNACGGCATEVARVIAKGGNYRPAIEDNKPVPSYVYQMITFQVSEE